jgi:hypothetical protein
METSFMTKGKAQSVEVETEAVAFAYIDLIPRRLGGEYL